MWHDYAPRSRDARPVVYVGEHAFRVAVADTLAKQALGLAGVGSLKPTEGMYFPFPEKKTATFWMKGMRMSIDLLWIKDNAVIGIEHNLPIPSTTGTLPTWSSPESVDAVLEVAAGTAETLKLHSGDTVRIIREERK